MRLKNALAILFERRDDAGKAVYAYRRKNPQFHNVVRVKSRRDVVGATKVCAVALWDGSARFSGCVQGFIDAGVQVLRWGRWTSSDTQEGLEDTVAEQQAPVVAEKKGRAASKEKRTPSKKKSCEEIFAEKFGYSSDAPVDAGPAIDTAVVEPEPVAVTTTNSPYLATYKDTYEEGD